MPYKTGKLWRGSVMIGGQRSQAGGFKTKNAARRWEGQEKVRLKKAMSAETVTDCLTLFNKYLDYISPRVSSKTLWEKKSLCKLLAQEWGQGQLVSTVTPEMASSFLLKQAKIRSNNASNRERKNLMSMWRWAQKFGIVQENPIALIDPLPHQPKLQYTPPQEDVQKILMAASRTERVFITCYLQTGARRSEIFRLTWDDINFQRGEVCLTTYKTRDGSPRRDWLPMSQELKDELKWWWKNRPIKDPTWVFVSDFPANYGRPFTVRKKFMSGLCKRAEVRPFGFHALRRFVASYLADNEKISSKVIQRILRHQSVHTTERYINRLNSDLAATMNKLSGLKLAEVKTEVKKFGKGGKR